MEEEYWKKINKTELCKELKEIRKIYHKLEIKEKEFCDVFCIHCKPGCGSCCEHFIPDISQVESDYLAFGLITEGIDEIVVNQLINYNGEGCPLYNKEDTAHHCTVYKWRPLICRLFGASASQNKNGEPIFKQCKWNDKANEITTELMEQHQKAVVKMGDYGLMIDNIRVDDGIRVLLPQALMSSINKIHYMMDLEDQIKKGS